MSQTSERLTKLMAMLERQPTDTFLLYGIALEHKKLGDARVALEYLDRVLKLDPNYCYAYHQKGLVHESQGDLDAAKQAYQDGIAAATRTGDLHAKGEIEAALELVE
jgi:Tfp pilus assembly protein PilF